MYTVLYVDDEPGLLEIGKLFLEQDGQFSIDTITSALSALDLMKTKTYDAIIADYQMPVMDGIEFLKKVRGSGDTIPFILFTGRGREEIVIQALNEGADFYLQKGGAPVAQFTELSHQVRQAVQQRRAEISIRDLERREADIINFLPDATFAIDRSGHIIAWNHAIEEMTGVLAADMLGKGNYEYAIPFYGQRQPILIDLIYESDEIISKKYTHIVHTNDILIANTSLPRPKGKPLTLMGKASPLYDRHGGIIGAIESIRDITEMKKAEESLRESEEQFQAFMDHLPVTAFIKDVQSTNLFVNRRMVEIFGEQEWIGKPVCEQFPRDAAKKMMEDDQQTIREGYRKTIEYLVAKNGTKKIFETHKFRIDRREKPPLIGGFAIDITEQKRAEDAIRESEEKYRSTIDAFPDAISVIDKEFRVILANTNLLVWMRTLGFSDDIIGKPFVDAFPFLSPIVLEEYRTIFSTGTTIVSEESSKINNVEFVTETRKIPLSEHGDIVAVVAIIRDVTERRRTDEALKESEERYRNVVEDQHEFISRFLPDGTHVFVNEAYCRYFGLTRDEILGHRFRPAIPSEDQECMKRFFASLTPDHPVDTIEHRIIMPDGTLRWQRWTDRAIFDPSGKVNEYQSVGQDITGRKQEELAQHENEQRLTSIYNTVGDSIFQLTVEPHEQYRFTSVNLAFGRTTGVPPGHVIGRKVDEIIPEPSLSRVREKYLQAIEEKGVVRWEETSHYPSGKLTGEVSVAPIFDQAGTCTHLIGSVHDITERKRAEEALRDVIKRLNLLSKITRHDINNQLTLMQAYLKLLETRQPDSSFNAHFQKVVTAAQRISSMIQFTLEYEEIGVNAPAWHDCHALADIAAKDVLFEKIMMKNDLPSGTEVFADPLIARVFYNLMDNAVRHGRKITTIRFFEQESDDEQLIVCEDDGEGVPADEKERIFKRDFGKNTGLGLFLSREILGITGITIRETGAPGEGARFEMLVPKGAFRRAGRERD